MSESSSDQTEHSLGGPAALAESGVAALAAPRRPLPKALRRLLKLAYVVAGLFLFILALRMLSKGAGGLGPFLKESLGIENAVNTLGFGWLFAYAVLSGSRWPASRCRFWTAG